MLGTCRDCGGPFIGLRRDTFLCRACSKQRKREARYRWVARNPAKRAAQKHRYSVKHAVCRLAVLACEGCGALWTRHGQSRGIFCARCSRFYERMANADRHRRRYWRLKQQKEAA